MSQKHLFGRAISFVFRPAADDEDVSAYSLTSARIYGPGTYPSDGQRANTLTGHIQAVTTWTATGVKEYTITFSALVDATPYAVADYETYFVAVNYKLESGGADVSDVEQIFVYRPDSATSKISVVPDDIFNLESRLSDVTDVLEIEKKIQVAIDDTIAKLEARGYKKRRIFNWEKLNLSVARCACALMCADLASEGSQFWMAKAERWEKAAETMFESALIGYDITGGDRPGAEEKRFSGAVFVAR